MTRGTTPEAAKTKAPAKDDLVGYFRTLERRAKACHLPPPNLIAVGAARCGTSTLYGLLGSSTDIYAPPIKELNYFGVNDANDRWTWQDYLAFFLDGADQRYRVDVSPIYLTRPASLRAISDKLDRPRIIITLREPTERFLSQYKHHAAMHGIDDPTDYCERALQRLDAQTPNATTWYAPEKNLAASLYADGVSACLEAFGEDDCLVLFYEDLAASPTSWIDALSAFLDTDVASKADATKRNRSEQGTPAVAAPVLERLRDLLDADIERLPAPIRDRAQAAWHSVPS